MDHGTSAFVRLPSQVLSAAFASALLAIASIAYAQRAANSSGTIVAQGPAVSPTLLKRSGRL